MSLFQALVLALLQGVTELFPVSSLGHTVILPKLLRWNIDQADPTFLAFVVLLHVGTATALLIYFWRDWLAIVWGVARSVVDGRTALDQLSIRSAVGIGSAQILALLPGISRSGSSMVAGLFGNLTHEAAARFAFLLATPVIFGAGVLKIPDLFTPVALPHLPVYLLGGVVAGVGAFLSVAYLMRYFRVGRLDPFAYYCAAFGILSLILLSR